MRIGTTLGPFLGMFWIDLAGAVVLREGHSGIAAEIRVDVPINKLAELIEGLVPAAELAHELQTQTEQRPSLLRSAIIEKEGLPSLTIVPRKPKHYEAREGVCSTCKLVFEFRAPGRVPTRCKDHRRSA